MPDHKNQLEQENAELKAQLSLLEPRSQVLALDSSSDEIDLRELWAAIWQGKWIILCLTAVFTAGSIYYALSIPDEYKSTAILAPASSSSSSSLSKLAGQFGGLASLAGVNLGGADSGDKTAIAMELIKTWGFLEDFIKNNQLEVEVFAAKGWDKRNNKLRIDETVYNELTLQWVRDIEPDSGKQAKPTSWELFEKIKNRISVSQDKNTGLISLSVEHFSPVVAKNWVDLLIVAINKHIQMQDRKEAQNSIDYLKQQISITSIAEMRTIFYQLIEEQTKTLMLAEISDEYVLKTLNPAKVAEQKSKPKRALIIVVGAMLGWMLSLFVVFVRYFFMGKK